MARSTGPYALTVILAGMVPFSLFPLRSSVESVPSRASCSGMVEVNKLDSKFRRLGSGHKKNNSLCSVFTHSNTECPLPMHAYEVVTQPQNDDAPKSG